MSMRGWPSQLRQRSGLQALGGRPDPARQQDAVNALHGDALHPHVLHHDLGGLAAVRREAAILLYNVPLEVAGWGCKLWEGGRKGVKVGVKKGRCKETGAVDIRRLGGAEKRQSIIISVVLKLKNRR